MANNSVQQPQQFQHQQQQPNNLQNPQDQQHSCKECGILLNSAESLEVHLKYHKENLLNNWATQAASSHGEETNNNTTKNQQTVKREFISSTPVTTSDNSDNSIMKKSPDYPNRATPDTSVNFGHPPTPQSYHSASSPYQNPSESATFSPGFQNYPPIKQERTSPNNIVHFNQQQQPNFPFNDRQYYNVESPSMQTQQNFQQDFLVHKMNSSNAANFRYQPYGRLLGPYEQGNPQVASQSPAYPAQPTPSPSPKQCDKCGFVCDSATQLIDHINITHPPTPGHLAQYQQNQFMFQNEIKTEEEAQSEILDLDSHKVHQVYQEEDKRQNGELNGHNNPHSVTTMLSPWSQQQKMFQDQHMFMPEQKIYQNGLQNMPDQKMFPHQPQLHSNEYINTSVTSSNHDNGGLASQLPYRPFEHLPQPASAVMAPSQVPNAPVTSAPPHNKSTSWKSNEARRPKTYNCTACNKWFTSSGHLKRHYNTTLHKNAVKSSGQPDPASLPISAHHHPARDSAASRDDQNSSSPSEESRGDDSLPPNFDRPGPMGGLLQQPPNGPYDRQPAPNINLHHPPNIHHPPLHSPMGHNSNPSVLPANISGHGSPPNVEAGPSATSNMDTRGLLPLTSTTPNPTTHGYNMAPMMPMDNSQFQIYPNELAPHVMQVMVTNSHNTIGEDYIQELTNTEDNQSQPLPSFAQLQNGKHYGMIVYGDANVGGLGPATSPFSFFTNESVKVEDEILYLNDSPSDYKITMMTPLETTTTTSTILNDTGFNGGTVTQFTPQTSPVYSPTNTNNNNMTDFILIDGEPKYFNENITLPKTSFTTSPVSPDSILGQKPNYEPAVNSPNVSSTVSAKPQGIHRCDDCDKTFNKSCYLTQHNKTFHSGDKPFKCHRCGKRFSCDKLHQKHLAKHAGEKPHKCELCPKQFNHKTDLRRHMCLHTGNKPYACDTCGKGFIRKDHMIKHHETHARRPSKLSALR